MGKEDVRRLLGEPTHVDAGTLYLLSLQRKGMDETRVCELLAGRYPRLG